MRLLITLTILFLSLSITNAQIVYSDYSDPDVCEGTNGDYWLTASSFQCTPGLPILHSKDLIHWELVNYALERLVPIDHYNTVQHGNGVWAPSIRKHGDTYYIYWGDPDFGVFMVKTKDPRGKWDDPVLVVEGKGIIDTCPLWDTDGRCYLVNGWANSRAGFNAVLTVRELNAEGTEAIGQPQLVYDGQVTGDHTIEGPKFYRHDGYYYILAPAGSVSTGWQVALRSKNPFGPYERKIVFNKDGIHQGGWVRDKFICFQEVSAYGRILHLLDVNWQSGWPMMSVSKSNTPNPLKVASPSLSYQWHANYQEHFGFSQADGTRVYSHVKDSLYRNLWDVSNLYLKKLDGETFVDTLCLTVTARTSDSESGMVIMGRDYSRYYLRLEGSRFILYNAVCYDADKGKKETVKRLGSFPARQYEVGAKTNYECNITFLITCRKDATFNLSYSINGANYTPIADIFRAREGRWIGAKYGIFSITDNASSKGWVDMKWKKR